jgi:hypothetical protein
MTREKPEQAMHKTAERTIRSLDQHFRARNRQGRSGARLFVQGFLVDGFRLISALAFGASLAG